ncbi:MULTISPECIES: MlaD family protein [unclassified Mycobacterium]|uniref:MlaD family protein n=1 Tax=unclassified Mycobacterium TaxID=2642494 RepID=UPI0029C6C88A|nr:MULTISPECIES: MlaD family protein [unclassified Mycobacterium]
MLSRLVRIQLVIFAAASVIGLGVMVFTYMQLPTMLGVGKVVVTLELPSSGGLYPLANVTYRGVQVGKVTSVVPTSTGAEAVLTLESSPRIPADLKADVRSVSALGEQYVELLPRGDGAGYLRDGSVIPVASTSVPQQVGPMLDQVSKLVDSIPKDKLSRLLDESFHAFNGAGYDLGSLLDSSSKLTADLNGVSDQTRALIDDSVPLLDSQAQTTDSIRTWSHSLAGVSDQLVANDPQLRTILRTAPGAAQEVSALLGQLKPTLPVLLANLTTVGQILVTYNPGLEQILVLLPAYIANQDSFALPQNNPTGWPLADFTITANDPPACTVGFLPPSQWRSPADTSEADTPDGLYCKLPQDSPISVRGARNYPCAGKPGKRAPTVEICNSDKPFEPLAVREHEFGPSPIDPNLISQGIPPDSRVNRSDNLYGPVAGTPMPPSAIPPPDAAPPSADQAPPTDDTGAIPAAPSAFSGNQSHHPSVAVARYDPATGRYLSPGGRLEQQSNLVPGSPTKTWKDLLPT